MFLIHQQIFLRELPGGLLVSEHYESWIGALEKERTEEVQSELRRWAGLNRQLTVNSL